MNGQPDTTLYITTQTVTGMSCGGCAVRIASALEAASSVVHLDVDPRRNESIGEHLPAFVGAEALAAAIRASGCIAEVDRTVPEVECARPAPDERISSSCGCSRKVEHARWFNLGTSTIG